MRLDAQTVTVPSLGLVKMDDRKRPAIPSHDDSIPPAKRQATSLNGAKPHPDAEMPWKDEIESYQKDAIFRQMREYKREKTLLEAQLSDMVKRSKYHDDHLLIVNSWFTQLIDEIRILINDSLSQSQPVSTEDTQFPTSLLFSNSYKFSEHLNIHSANIKSLISILCTKIPPVAPDFHRLQGEITKLLAAEKEHMVELSRISNEKEQLSDRLENASYRYMVAEKKLDRAKSAAVIRLERQAMIHTSTEDNLNPKDDNFADGSVADCRSSTTEIEAARKEAIVLAEKRKEQLDKLEIENKKLIDEVTGLNLRLCGLTDEDYSKSSLFKVLKSQHEDVIKRINDLEATNIQLREEAQRLHAERTSYRMRIEEEQKGVICDLESQLARAETDLTRIRNARDELSAELSLKKTNQERIMTSTEQIMDLAGARESRVDALETEVDRLRLQLGETKESFDSQKMITDINTEELLGKIATMEKENNLLSNELPYMEAAWKKAQALAAKKITDVVSWEDQVSRLAAEKVKADQKYFAAMKAKESRDAENRNLRAQNAKSSEIVTQLKESETSSRSLIVNQEKQIAEFRDAVAYLTNQCRSLQQKLSEQAVMSDSFNEQITELGKTLSAKDELFAGAAHDLRQMETEVETLKLRLTETKSSLEGWKKKGLGNQTDEYEMLRTIAICNVCRKNFKNVAIKNCGHVLCQDCVEERISSRSRKCPLCNKSFGVNDYMRITL